MEMIKERNKQFQNLYNKIQDINHEYHQYTFEEYEYLKRKENKKRL